jgi:hypothetical protein
MKLKGLKNNYTTVEQSKRLVEYFGLLVDTADLMQVTDVDGDVFIMAVNDNTQINELVEKNPDEVVPIWSVGRLIEIYAIAMDSDFIEFDTYANSPCVLTELLEKFEKSIDLLDFTRLYNYE